MSEEIISSIRDIGFTVLSSGGEHPLIDIVIIHGIQGHPYRTWTARNVEQKRYLKDHTPWKKEYYKADVYWPVDFLAKDFPDARILVYGYDSKVSKFFKGPADKSSFMGHAKELLHGLVDIRSEADQRPLLFICHSLGGILVKEVLRRSEPGRVKNDFAGVEKVFTSTCGIIFMGTPHRGGNYGSIGKAAESIVRHIGFDTNNNILKELHEDSQILSLVQEEFQRILDNSAPFLTVYSFQESTGLAGVQGLNAKVVDDTSSTLNYRYEIVRSITGNHREMCRFDYSFCIGYLATHAAVKAYLKKIKLAHPWGKVDAPLFLTPFPTKDEQFVGRGSELRWLQDTLCADADQFVEAAIVGLGGTGYVICSAGLDLVPTFESKTRVANEFSYHQHERQETEGGQKKISIVWIHASSQARVEHSFKQIARELKLVEDQEIGDDVFPVVKDWFQSSHSGRWLLIIDNADDEDVFFSPFTSSQALPHAGKTRRLCDFLPLKPSCGILYTSRNRICAQRLLDRTRSNKILTLLAMPKTDSISMLQNELRSSGICDSTSIDQSPMEDLVSILDNLPLAITQAACFMRENNQTPSQYLELFKDLESEHAAFLAEDFVDWRRDSDMPNALLLTWRLSFSHIERRSALAVRLLSLFSVLDRHGVPGWMIVNYFQVGGRFEIVKAIGLLESFSFYDSHYGIHRLVQLATRMWIGPETWNSAVQDALRFLCNIFAWLNAHEWSDWRELSDNTLQRILDYYPHTKSVLEALGPASNNDRTLATLDGFFDEWSDDGLGSEFASEAMQVYEKISNGDCAELIEMMRFVKTLREGTRRFYIFYQGPFKPESRARRW